MSGCSALCLSSGLTRGPPVLNLTSSSRTAHSMQPKVGGAVHMLDDVVLRGLDTIPCSRCVTSALRSCTQVLPSLILHRLRLCRSVQLSNAQSHQREVAHPEWSDVPEGTHTARGHQPLRDVHLEVKMRCLQIYCDQYMEALSCHLIDARGVLFDLNMWCA